MARKLGFRLGIYVFKDAEIVDYAAPAGVISVARRLDPELDTFLIAESMRPVQTQAGFTVLPNYSFADQPTMDAFLIPGGFGTRQEMNNTNLHRYIRALPPECLLTSVCTGSWIYARMGLLDGLPPPTVEPDRLKPSHMGKTPIDRLAEMAPACRVSRARVVDAGASSPHRRHRLGHGDGFSPPAAGRLRRSLHRRRGPGHGIPAGLRAVPARHRIQRTQPTRPLILFPGGDCHVCVQGPFQRRYQAR
jgi:putative intracellular protease/amidase